MSAECQELNHLFSRCVDGNRIKVPKHLEDPPKPHSGAPPFILDILREQIGTTSSAGNRTSSLVDMSCDRLQLLLSPDDVAFSEFELLQMTMRWCTQHGQSLEDFFEYFDFSKLTDVQKVWLVAQFPAKRYIPDLIMNGLLQSSILCKEELQYFRLDHFGLRWKKIFDSSSDRLGRFMDVMGRSLEDFHRKFIVIKVTNRLTLAIYMPKPLLKYQECVIHDTVRLFSYPHSQEDLVTYRRSLPTLVNYRLYFDDDGLQLYQTKRQDTWIFIRRPGIDDSSFRAIEDRGDQRRVKNATVEAGINSDLIISIALGKFSSSLARHMGSVNREPIIGAEVYVISNRDTFSMQVLDKWLEFIDTREVMPLFDRQELSYRLADMRDVDWTKERRSLEMLEVFCLLANDMQAFVVEPFRAFLLQVRHIPLSVFGSLVRHICLVVSCPDTALDLLMGVLELESSRLLVGRPKLVKYFVANLIGIALEHMDEAKDSRALREDELQLRFDSARGMVSSRLRIDSHSKVRFAVNDHVQLTAASLPMNTLETRPYTMDALIERAEPGKVVFQCFHPLPPYMEDCAWKVKNCGSFATSQAMFEALERFVTAAGEFCHIHDQVMGFEPPYALPKFGIERHHHEELASVSARSEFTASVGREAQASGSPGLGNVECAASDNPAVALENGCTTATQDGLSTARRSDLNDSQNEALRAALASSLTCLWGPPGTGKTHTVAVILEELLKEPERRILVAAPTHNAVDNVMRKFLRNMQQRGTWAGVAFRVSTDVSKSPRCACPFT